MQPEHWMGLNIGCGKVSIEGFVNSDLRCLPGVDVQFNAFVFPWPFRDEAFDELYASHLVEHIPHLVRVWRERLLEPEWDEDGFFVFFREAWRVLKPGGLFTLAFPYAQTREADQDPTHVRAINEVTFSYLWQESDTFDYQLGYRFTQLDFSAVSFQPGWAEMLQKDKATVDFAVRHSWNVVGNARTTLQKV